jgi:hypothetical protein
MKIDFNPVILSSAIGHDLWAAKFGGEDQDNDISRVEEDNCEQYFENHWENFRAVNQLV